MAESFYDKNSDSIDISELASLNDEISDDFIEQLQAKLMSSMSSTFSHDTVNPNDDSTLFEEPVKQDIQQSENSSEHVPAASEQKTGDADTSLPVKKEEVSVNTNFDDNFIKKYKAKLNKKANSGEVVEETPTKPEPEPVTENEPIEKLSQGNIKERPLTRELKDYNDSLDFLDGNVKYSKYVIYIDPQNVDFIEGLTVKERKNLINGILRQQDDIAITKQRFKVIQTVIRQVIIAVLTLSISIPFMYYAINASLEATIDNQRRSQTNWQTLYKEHGKITRN